MTERYRTPWWLPWGYTRLPKRIPDHLKSKRPKDGHADLMPMAIVIRYSLPRKHPNAGTSRTNQ